MAGYYTLLAGQVEREGATRSVSAGTSTRFPIPVCLLARLAVSHEEQGRGLGAAGLLLDALERTVRASHDIAIRAVVVQAIDPALGMDRGDGRGPALVPNAMLGADKWRGDVPVPQRVFETRPTAPGGGTLDRL